MQKQSQIEGGNFIKHVLKKGGKNSGQLSLSDLDEKMLKKKLDSLTKELNEYKDRCAKYKKENLWYQQEIDVASRDNAEYISYLESKKEEKLVAIQKLADGNKKDQEMFMEKKNKYKEEYEAKIAEYQDTIAELEVKLNGKEDEFLQLSDTMLKRAKHYEDIQKIRDEITRSEISNQHLITSLEKSLLDTRIKLQVETDLKIKEMEEMAEEKAANYLARHTDDISAENKGLERKLASITKKTQSLIMRRDQLHHVIAEIERETRLRDDLVEIRAANIGRAVQREGRERRGRALQIAKWRRHIVEGVMIRKGVGSGTANSIPDDWMDLSDDED